MEEEIERRGKGKMAEKCLIQEENLKMSLKVCLKVENKH